MSNKNTPWKDKAAFVEVLLTDGIETWKDMASFWTKRGMSITESTVRRWADTHNVRDIYYEQKLQKALSQLKEALDQVSTLEKELERVQNEPREATPEELVAAQREVQKARSRASRYKKVAESLASDANLLDDIKAHLEGVMDGVKVEPIKVKLPKPSNNDESVSLVLGLSDGHVGDVVDPETVNGQNAFDLNIAARRLERVVDVTTSWAQNYAAFCGVDELVVLLNGDNISNMDFLHPDESVDYARVCKQVLDSALLYSQVIAELSLVFPKVRVITSGDDNHSRTTKKQSTSAVSRETSWNTILNEFIASHLRDIKNIDFHLGESYLTFFNVKDFTWCLTHGHNVRGGGMAGVPVNGLKKLNDIAVSKQVAAIQTADLEEIETLDDAVKLMRGLVSVVLAGHHHQAFAMQQNGTEVRIMPSLKGPDTFSLDKLGKYNPAGQALFAVNSEHGIVGDHTINLQGIMTNGECRYVMGALEGTTPSSYMMQNWMEHNV